MHSPTEFVHFKNGIFYGSVTDQRRQGEAICLYDNGAIFMGHFRANQPNGQCLIILEPDTYFIGTLKKGMLDGSFTVRSPRLHIYSQTIMNRIQGEVVVIDKQEKRARVWEIENNQGTCIREAEYDQQISEEKILRAVSPYIDIFPTLQQYFALQSSSLFSVRTDKLHKTEISLSDNLTRKLVVRFSAQRLLAAGVLEGGQMIGLGYLWDVNQGLEFEGQICNGALDGEGAKRDLSTGKAIFGKFVKGDIRSLETLERNGDTVENSLLALKKRIHLHALQFTNDYLNERPIYLLRNFYETMADNEVKYSQYLRQGRGDNEGKKLPNKLGLARQPSNQQLSYNIQEYNLIKNALSSRR